MFYHILMEKKGSLINRLIYSGHVKSEIHGAELILTTNNPEECQKIAGNYKLIFADPNDYSKYFTV